MFKTEKEFADAMLSGKVFKNKGWICKFDPAVLKKQSTYSPFVCRCEYSNDWKPMNASWFQHKDMIEIFEDCPDIEVDTKVEVCDELCDDWVAAHFDRWMDDGTMSCFACGRTSHSEDSTATWKYWRIIGGEFNGKSNCN